MPFPVDDGWETLVNINPATGHYGCRAMWERNAEILGQFALGRAIDFLERDMVWEKTSPYNSPLKFVTSISPHNMSEKNTFRRHLKNGKVMDCLWIYFLDLFRQ